MLNYALNHLTAEIIISAFDRCIEYHWGEPREFVHRTDKATAEKWLAAGADLVGCVIVFHDRMSWMVDKRDGEQPKTIGLFNDSIEAMIHKFKGDNVTSWDIEYSRWKARCMAWQKDSASWLENMWGAPPNDTNCRAPTRVLIELGILNCSR